MAYYRIGQRYQLATRKNPTLKHALPLNTEKSLLRLLRRIQRLTRKVNIYPIKDHNASLMKILGAILKPLYKK